MPSRVAFFLITAFWLTMNVLLWRSESSSHTSMGSAVAPDLIFNKILTSPDASSLEIYHHGKKIGFCRWTATVGAQSNQNFSSEFEPEGMVADPTSYSLDLDGNFTPDGSTNRLRFDMSLKLSTDRVWQEFDLRASMRPDSWELHASAAAQNVRLSIDDSLDPWEQTFTFDELRNPQTLLREFGGPMALTMLGTLGNLGFGNSNKTNTAASAPILKWEANNDTMRFGHSKVKVYRLHTKVMGAYEIFIFVSHVGEILWIELPDKIVLSNDAFTHF